jgi:hypothetical protein
LIDFTGFFAEGRIGEKEKYALFRLQELTFIKSSSA